MAMINQDEVGIMKMALKSNLASDDNLDINDIRFKGEPLDIALERFLQARKFNIADTEKSIRETIVWRKMNALEYMKMGKETCLGAKIEEVTQFYGGGYAGFCKQGRPIWYEETGQVDIECLHCITTDVAFSKYHVCLMEELQDKYLESSQKYNKIVNKTVSILNLRGVTVSKLSSETLAFVKLISGIDSANYPETMGQMFIINAPGMFSFSWSIIQGYLDPRTVSKIEVFGGPELWKPRLLQVIDEDQLPIELGGSFKACGSYTCFKEKVLASGDTVEESIDVSQGQQVYYKFFTRAAGNINFQVFFIEEQQNNEIPILPERPYEGAECSSGKCVSGVLTSPGKGRIAAKWNHPNWWSRTLLYRVVLN